MITLDTLPRPPCPWTFASAPLSCDTLNAPTTYRVHYEVRQTQPDTYTQVCIERLGGSYPGKVQSLPLCTDHDATVEDGLAGLGLPAGVFGLPAGAFATAPSGGQPAVPATAGAPAQSGGPAFGAPVFLAGLGGHGGSGLGGQGGSGLGGPGSFAGSGGPAGTGGPLGPGGGASPSASGPFGNGPDMTGGSSLIGEPAPLAVIPLPATGLLLLVALIAVSLWRRARVPA